MLSFFKNKKAIKKSLLYEGPLEKQPLEKQHKMLELEEGTLQSNSVILYMRKWAYRGGMTWPKEQIKLVSDKARNTT